MAKIKIDEEIVKDVEDLVDIDKPKTDEKEASIIFDGRQYTLKIPKKIAEKVGISPASDKFLFEVKTYPIEENRAPDLIITLTRGSDEK